MAEIQNVLQRAAQDRASQEAERVKDKDKERQRNLAASILGKKVHDIVDFQDDNGDDVFVFIYLPPHQKDVTEEQKVTVMVLLSEQAKSHVRFDEVAFRKGRYWLPNGDNLIIALRQQSYTY